MENRREGVDHLMTLNYYHSLMGVEERLSNGDHGEQEPRVVAPVLGHVERHLTAAGRRAPVHVQ